MSGIKEKFWKDTECEAESFIIPPDLFEITKPFISTEKPYCKLIKTKSNYFLKIFYNFIIIASKLE